jgi:hypothetical protein
MSQYKFTVLNIMSIKMFGEFMGLSPKGLKSFKIQTKFNFDCFLNF